MNVGVNYMREHMPSDARVHYALLDTGGGAAPLSLTMRELRARYRASVLGFLWTFLNPTLSMFVYWLVFQVVMVRGSGGLKAFPYFIFCGLLPWIFFSTSVLGGTTSVSDRKDLLTKVRFESLLAVFGRRFAIGLRARHLVIGRPVSTGGDGIQGAIQRGTVFL